jgi:hypothetical protein
MKKKMYILDYGTMEGAGKWIYQGYYKAFENLGYECQYYIGSEKELSQMSKEANVGKNYSFIMPDMLYKVWKEIAIKHNWIDQFNVVMNNANGIYMFANPTKFPQPWGSHPNFKSLCVDVPNMIDEINNMDNVKLWTFLDLNEDGKDIFYNEWKTIYTVPLAFDNLSYQYLEDDKYKFDVCFIGGRANNGFDEKYKIMVDHFTAFKDSGLKCGIFVGRGLSHEQENKILYNSKVAINIHDAYQRELGLDTNERTFKSLGLNGILVSDEISQIKRIFPHVKMTNNPKEMVKLVKEYVNMSEDDLESIKEENRNMILQEHTYIDRASHLLRL